MTEFSVSYLDGPALSIFSVPVVIPEDITNFEQSARRFWFARNLHAFRVPAGRLHRAPMKQKENHASEADIFLEPSQLSF